MLGCAVQTVALPDAQTMLAPVPPVRRGLFVTRAQPFHLGHRAFVRQILAELDEVVVLVSKANVSHSLDNPATAGERLELIQPLLEAEARGRHHLCAAPYVDDDAANFAELKARSCRRSRRSTPTARARPARSLRRDPRGSAGRRRSEVSGSEVRRRILAGEPYDELLPPEVARALSASPVPARLRALGLPEVRG